MAGVLSAFGRNKLVASGTHAVASNASAGCVARDGAHPVPLVGVGDATAVAADAGDVAADPDRGEP